jgi:hypothetical protein
MNAVQIVIVPCAFVQNRTITLVQLIHFQKLSILNIYGTGLLSSLQ